MQEKLHFKVSSALKDIIGRDLITDDFIAVFELVKNSFDAYATQVDLYFENIYGTNPKIIIKDNGKGMNYEDLNNKWLFVAYSAKKEGTEDDNFDYRNRILQKRTFAGAKGIGRFSCDRLGKTLYLETTKLEENPQTEVLITEWENFEGDLKDEFININVLHETKTHSDYELIHGTVLEISDLRSVWDSIKLLKLKDSLSKLIAPNEKEIDNNFSIYFHVSEELENDKIQADEKKIINGKVKNFIFETLGLKTTKIVAKISGDSKVLQTGLFDGGTMIYKIKEHNQLHLLHDIKITLYYLNRAAKMTFSKKMGLASRKYGHVFVYKNGIRIYPYGEPGEDPLKIDVRKNNKRYSTLGIDEIIGQIDIEGDNGEFKETSSRSDGLINNDSNKELEAFFFKILERLEKYVVDVQKWGLTIENPNDLSIKERVLDFIASMTGSFNLLDVKYPNNFLEILESSQSESVETIVKNLNLLALKSGNNEILALAQSASIKLEYIRLAKEEAEKEAAIERERARKSDVELNEKISENLFLKSVKSQDFDEIISLMHHIGIVSWNIDILMKGLFRKIHNDEEIKPNEMVEIIKNVTFENKKILTISKFATKANFKLFTDEAVIDLINYISEYVSNVLTTLSKQSIVIHLNGELDKSFIMKVRPIEINILIDNLVSNSIKANSKNFWINFSEETSTDRLSIRFKDDGEGILEKNLDKVFDFGFTTTSGSGLGLFHVKRIVDTLKGVIKIESSKDNGTEILITLKNSVK